MSSYLGLPSYHHTKAQNIHKILNKTLFLRQLMSPHDDPLFYKNKQQITLIRLYTCSFWVFSGLTTAFLFHSPMPCGSVSSKCVEYEMHTLVPCVLAAGSWYGVRILSQL